MCLTATVMFQKLVWAIFLYTFLNIFIKTEGGLITDFRKLCEYTNIRSNVPVEKSVQRLQKTKSSSSNRKWHISSFLVYLVIISFQTSFINL